jgi:hypothetical protein
LTRFPESVFSRLRGRETFPDVAFHGSNFPCADLLQFLGRAFGLSENKSMKNATQNPTTKNDENVKNDDKAAALLAMQLQVSAEVLEFSIACQNARKIGASLGFNCLLSLAQAMGESAGKTGRPSPETFHAFTTALTQRKLSYEQRAELARKANASVKEGFKPLAVITGKATHDRGSQTYRFNVPAATSEQLG